MQLCHDYMLWLYGAGTVLEAPERRGANDRARQQHGPHRLLELGVKLLIVHPAGLSRGLDELVVAGTVETIEAPRVAPHGYLATDDFSRRNSGRLGVLVLLSGCRVGDIEPKPRVSNRLLDVEVPLGGLNCIKP